MLVLLRHSILDNCRPVEGQNCTNIKDMLISYLVGPEAASVTGANLKIDGGLTT
jgi:hypothetical protein